MDILQIKRKQEEVERALAIFFPRCTNRHPRHECPLNVIEVCEENHATDNCPSLSGLKVVYQGAEGDSEKLYFLNQRTHQGPWPYQQGMQGAHYSHSIQIKKHLSNLGTLPLIHHGPHLLLALYSSISSSTY